MVRRYDPERRERIIDAAIRVVADRGIGGLSHRTVAAEADVPLGSTTYHFGSLDELLVAALRRCNESFARTVRESPYFADPEVPLADELTRLLGEWFAAGRGPLALEYELYLAALRRPALRQVAAEWADTLAALIADRTDRATARALTALVDGISLQVLLTGGDFDPEYTREMLARVADGASRGAPPDSRAAGGHAPATETGSPARGSGG